MSVLPHSCLCSLPSEEGEVVGIVLKDFVLQQAASALRQGNFCAKFEEAINLGADHIIRSGKVPRQIKIKKKL